ncbi:hypothetical protein RHS01_04844 [Rhizoctonia solani]|uniref:NADP-dependent oxidoreductase domain-containing protein n=1 Tax=Rhizoctonia solani TaxID=456999 RepID=A0A8H7M5L7_9AGAM|nr:hypothetical protein RHS01_04844 [Rhizoctonia solani]
MVQFKLLHRGLVRKVTFKNVEQPSWHELSWKIGDVCQIPHAAVALTYLDPDGDKITISSQPELMEYYYALEEDDFDPSSTPHKFIVRNLSEDRGREHSRRRLSVGPYAEDEAERDPTKLRLSGYSTFADALSPLARSAGGTDLEDASSPEKEDLPGGWFGAWGKVLGGGNESSPTPAPAPAASAPPPPPPPPPPPIPEPTKPISTSNTSSRLDPDSNPWANDGNVTKTPAWAASTTPTSTAKAPALPWAPPSHVATGTLKGPSRGPPPQQQQQQTQSKLVPPPVAATVHMDSMVADRATTYEGSPAVLATVPRGRRHKKKLEKAAKEEEARRAAEAANPTGSKFEEMELKAMEREAARERDESARASAEAATRAAVEEQRRQEQHEWDRERERLERIKIDERTQPHQTHQRGVSDLSHSSEWEHVQDQTADQEDEQSYRDRIEAARANVFGTSPSNAPTIRQRKSSTRSKDKTGKSSRPNSKIYPPTPAPKKFFDSDLVSENGQNGASGSAPATPGIPAPPSTAQVCSDVADLLVSFGRILDNERELLDAIRETFSSGPHPGALSSTFHNRRLSPEMLRIVTSVDDLLTKILPSRPAPSPHENISMALEPRVPTPSVTPTPTIPADPEFSVPKSEFATSFEFANRGRQQGAPIINVPRPKYPASSLTREGYSTGTTPPSQTSYGFGTSSYPSNTSPDKSSHARSRSRPPPGDFEIVPPSFLPPQARVVPPPVVPGEETDGSPMTPDPSRGFARHGGHEGGLVLASQSQRSTDTTKADMDRQLYKSQRELYKLERAERKKEMEERAAAKAERKRAKAAASSDPKIADLTSQLQGLVPPRPHEAERQYIENPYDNGPRTAGRIPDRSKYRLCGGLGQVTLVTSSGIPRDRILRLLHPSPLYTRIPRHSRSIEPGEDDSPLLVVLVLSDTPILVRRPRILPALKRITPLQQDLAKRVALRLTEMGYTPQKYPTLPSIVGHRIRPLMNTPGVNENELAYHIVRDLFNPASTSIPATKDIQTSWFPELIRLLGRATRSPEGPPGDTITQGWDADRRDIDIPFWTIPPTSIYLPRIFFGVFCIQRLYTTTSPSLHSLIPIHNHGQHYSQAHWAKGEVQRVIRSSIQLTRRAAILDAPCWIWSLESHQVYMRRCKFDRMTNQQTEILTLLCLCRQTVYNAIKSGYRLLDGAGDYGNEKEAGEGVARAIKEGIVKREDLFITSKLWNTFHAKEHAHALARKQLADWGLDYFDLFLIHFPVSLKYVDPAKRYPPEWFGDDGKTVELQNTPIQETWQALEELVDAGLAKNIGISNMQGSLIIDIFRYARIAPQSFLELNMGQGVKSLLEGHSTIESVAKAHNKTAAQVLLRWASQRGIAVIPKSNNQGRLEQNLASTDFDLSDEQIKSISALNQGIRFNNPADIDPRMSIFA